MRCLSGRMTGVESDGRGEAERGEWGVKILPTPKPPPVVEADQLNRKGRQGREGKEPNGNVTQGRGTCREGARKTRSEIIRL